MKTLNELLEDFSANNFENITGTLSGDDKLDSFNENAYAGQKAIINGILYVKVRAVCEVSGEEEFFTLFLNEKTWEYEEL